MNQPEKSYLSAFAENLTPEMLSYISKTEWKEKTIAAGSQFSPALESNTVYRVIGTIDYWDNPTLHSRNSAGTDMWVVMANMYAHTTVNISGETVIFPQGDFDPNDTDDYVFIFFHALNNVVCLYYNTSTTPSSST